jgi:hypothetical protein
MPDDSYSLFPPPKYSIAAVLSFCAAIGSLVSSCTGHPYRGILLAVVSCPFALFGLLRSISPSIKGAWMSLGALVFGVVGLVVSIIAAILH